MTNGLYKLKLTLSSIWIKLIVLKTKFWQVQACKLVNYLQWVQFLLCTLIYINVALLLGSSCEK